MARSLWGVRLFLVLIYNISRGQANSVQKQAREALEYVAFVENNQCSGGTENSLDLQFDHSVWNLYATAAVRTANFLTNVITTNNDSLLNILSDEILFSLVRNNVQLKTVIFGSAIAIEPHPSIPYPLFCPYAYKKNNTVFSHDLSINYTYTNNITEWYHVLREQDYSNITFVKDMVQFRAGDSLLPTVEIKQPIAVLEDGHWTKPYFDCGGGNIWMVTYSSPFFAFEQLTDSLEFRGVATIDIELTNIDINQCDLDATSESGAFDVFRGTHNCQFSTKCVFLSGGGFRRGSYRCECEKGYYFPNTHASQKYYSGFDIEDYFTKNNLTSSTRFMCNTCAPGCDTCVDSSPCVFTRNIIIKCIVLILTIVTIIGLIIVSALTFQLRHSKVIKSGSPIFLLLMCAGSLLMCLQIFAMFPDATTIVCMMLPWPYHVGFVLMYGALLLKTWRISVIFREGTFKKINLPDKTLLGRMIPILAITVGYLVAWTSANRVTTQTRVTNSGLKFTMCTENWWSYAAYAMEVLMLLFGVYLCFTVRKAPASFNESKHITWSIYNAIILSTFILILVQFVAETSGPDLIYILYFLNSQVVVTMTMVLIFAPKFHAVYMKLDVRRRDSIPTVTGAVTQVRRNVKTVGTQTNFIPDIQRKTDSCFGAPFRKISSKVEPAGDSKVSLEVPVIL